MINYAPIFAAHAQWLADPTTGKRAILRDADLRDANLCYANLSGADLSGANLRDANLCYAILSGAILSGVDLHGTEGIAFASDAAERLRAAAEAALANPDALEMGSWHTCDTTHCIGGWAIHQAGALGAFLEEVHGAPIAALFLLGLEAHSHFWDNNRDARAYLQSVLDAAQT